MGIDIERNQGFGFFCCHIMLKKTVLWDLAKKIFLLNLITLTFITVGFPKMKL